MDRTALTLYELSKCMKSKSDDFSISSSEFGKCLGVSQQTASRLLNELEAAGMISCTRGGKGQVINMTEKGLSSLNDMLLNLRTFLECAKEPLAIEAKVATGFGEGAYYIQAYAKKLEAALGFIPYPGTLNLKPTKPYPAIDRFASGEIAGFTENNRSFGAVKYVLAKLSSKSWEEDCFILLPQRTHHVVELEVVAREKLRDKRSIKDDDVVTLTICG
jgi:riboflavin kinase